MYQNLRRNQKKNKFEKTFSPRSPKLAKELNLLKEGCWEIYCKCIEQNAFTYFISMHCTNRRHHADVALRDNQDFMAAR